MRPRIVGTTVVLDTSALMMPVQSDCRVFEEVERVTGAVEGELDYVVPAPVVAELEKLADGNGREATAARVGRDLSDRCRVVDAGGDYADDAVLAVARDLGAAYVVTNDRDLRDRLLDLGIRVIGLRDRTKLAVTEP